MCTPRRAGFSLVELLVVVGIIAVLVAMLFPVLSAARRKAHEAQCQSNLRQLGIALSLYAQDYDGWLVLDWTGGAAAPRDYSWRVALIPYVRSLQLFQCPDARLAPAFDGTVPDVPEEQSGYAVNAAHWQPGPPSPPALWGVPESQVELPTDTVYVMDGSGAFEWSNGNGTGSNEHGCVRDDPAATRHSGGCNYLFCDGHVKHLQPTQVVCSPGRCDWSIEDEAAAQH